MKPWEMPRCIEASFGIADCHDAVTTIDLDPFRRDRDTQLKNIPDMKLLREQLHRSVQRAREQVAQGALPPVAGPDGEEQ